MQHGNAISSRRFALLAVFASVCCLLAASAEAEFTADNIFVVANGSVAESVQLGEHYLDKRQIDRNHFLSIPLPSAEKIDREDFERDIVLPIRKAIEERNLSQKIRVLVPLYGIPIFVNAPLKEMPLLDAIAAIPQLSPKDIPPSLPSLKTSENWLRVLSRSPSVDTILLSARLSYAIGRQAGLALYRQQAESRYTYDEGHASVDNELSFLWYDRSQYSVEYRIPSPFFHGQGTPPGPFPLVLVSRIDGPTPEAATKLIDQAILAEQIGLSGKVYIDARGLQKSDGQLGYYDEEMRKAVKVFERQSVFPVVLENSERRFSNYHEAPDVALYCGWYRLRQYEDAFTFAPGAIGYHIASEEAVSLHDTGESGWCKNAVERGITSTLGPVSEPYVDAFPSPLEYFGLIATGRYSLVEAYALTSRSASWQMLLLGDPLYNPFRKKPLIEPEQLVQMPEWPSGLKPLPRPPSEIAFPDPVVLRAGEPEAVRRTVLEVQMLLTFEPRKKPAGLDNSSAGNPVFSIVEK